MLNKKNIFFVLAFLPILIFGQARMVVNNNAFVVISNNAKVVLENSNPNAITVAGTGANIVSEGQTNQIVWNISNTTGSYTIPWTTRPVIQGGNGTKIPMTMQLTAAGSNDGIFNFSTYETATDMNTAYPTFPTAVTSMTAPALGMADGSLYVVDRFWILDNTSYTTKPNATLSFTYDDAANEIGGTNLLTEANLRAQRWNIAQSSWELLLFGSTNTATNVTSNVVAPAADFWPVWILVDLNFPLPVTLTKQNVVNRDCLNELTWTTASETNNDYFSILRSYDAISWANIGQVQGQGNSSTSVNYSYIDNSASTNGTVYYKIQQVDFDGTKTSFDPMAVQMFCSNNMISPLVYPNPASGFVTISQVKNGKVEMYDAAGRLVLESQLNEGENSFAVEQFASGMYMFNIQSGTDTHQIKFIKK
jgi:hypothetical protein